MFPTKKLKKISFWNKTWLTYQVLKQNVFNVSDCELKTFQCVSFWTKVFTQQGVGFQIKLFGPWQSLKFDFFKKQSLFAKETWNIKKTWMFLPLYKRQFLHSACISKMHFSDWKFSENQFLSWNFERVRFWIKYFSKCQFQKKTISKIPLIPDWVFYKVPDFELNFLWGRNNLEKNIGWKRITFWFIFSKKKTTILSVCLNF